MRKLVSLLILSLCLKGYITNGQIPFFQQYSLLKKNEPVQVNKVFQDSKGFVWFATNKGAFRFDGLHYRHYTKADSLVDINVTALAEDSVGRIWLGHHSGQISFLERGIFKTFETREGPAIEPVSDILFDKRGRMWFSTLNDGLYYFVKERLHRIDEKEGLPDLFIYDLFEDPDGKIWAGTDGGIAICTLIDGNITIKVLNNKDGLPDVIIKKMHLLDGDTISIATEDAGIVNYNFKTNRSRPLVSSPWVHGAISDFITKENQVWIAAPRKGLVVYDRLTKRLKLYDHGQGHSLFSINDLMKDAEGNIWLGAKGGVSRTLGDAVEHYESLEPVKDHNILAVAVDHANRIWFSNSEGLFMKTIEENGSGRIEKKLGNTLFKNAAIISLFVDVDGFVWAGLYGNGLLRINPGSNEVKHFNKELRNGNILSITGTGNVVWVATLGGGSSISFSADKYVVTNYGSADGLISDFIYQVFIDSKGRAWFATDGKGVSMLDQSGFHHYQEGLTSRVVYSFAEDANNNIWISSQDHGVYQFDGKKFIAIEDVKLRDNAVQSLATDKHGNLIITHNFGIDVYNINSRRMRYWGEETGIRDKYPNLNAIATDANGQVFIGTSKGIVKFSLTNDPQVAIPRPSIDAVKIYDEFIDISSAPELNYDENNVTLNYLGFWYQNSQNLNYQYKLENYDLDWIETRNEDVTYSRLPPGNYIFRLKVSDTENFSDAPETSLAFSISPPFWRTSPFYILIIAAVVVSVYCFIRFRERKLLEDKLILEAKVEERTQEIQTKTEEIQAQNEEIMAQAEEIQGINENLEMLVKERTAELEKKNKALEEYAFINAHKLRSPVASILGLLNLLSKSDLKDDSKVIRDHLQDSAKKLDEVVRSITQAIEKADSGVYKKS